MANNGTKNSNDSQFIITLGACSRCISALTNLKCVLDRADELHGKHTLFGRCMGDTVYSA
jgi:peptidyl-prolyl cis-trans isomerase SDCCAG10